MIEYRYGYLFQDMNEVSTNIVIAHIVNNVGAFGKGFAATVAEYWPHIRDSYFDNYRSFSLGDILMGDAAEGGRLVVANLFAQDGLPGPNNHQPIKYMALAQCLDELSETLDECRVDYEIWMPRIGTGYARGKWEIIEPMIESSLTSKGHKVVVYDLP